MSFAVLKRASYRKDAHIFCRPDQIKSEVSGQAESRARAEAAGVWCLLSLFTPTVFLSRGHASGGALDFLDFVYKIFGFKAVAPRCHFCAAAKPPPHAPVVAGQLRPFHEAQGPWDGMSLEVFCTGCPRDQAKEGARLQGNLGQRRGPAQGPGHLTWSKFHSRIRGKIFLVFDRPLWMNLGESGPAPSC